MLWQRGLECKGCAEKPDFIKMLTEHLNDPILKGREDSNSGKTKTNSNEDKSVDDVFFLIYTFLKFKIDLFLIRYWSN